MSQLFKRAAFFTDIHFGKGGDSEVHNQDCLRYIDWFIRQAQEANCDTVFFLGDWFESQVKIRKDTNDYSNQALEELAAMGIPVYMLVGNHDMYYKTNRKAHALIHVPQFETLRLIDEVTVEGDVLMAPYLVSDEHVLVTSEPVKYILGHFELPGFLTNALFKYPDRGGLNQDDFGACDFMFSGHFHRRQRRRNRHGIPVEFIGNAFPQDYNDVGDRERGCMLLDWDGEPQYMNWEEAPNYNRAKLSEILAAVDDGTFTQLYNKWSVIEVQDDIGLEVPESIEFKESLADYVREVKVKPKTEAVDATQEANLEDVNTKSPHQLVLAYLDQLDTEGSEYDTEMLKAVFEQAEVDG